MEKARREGWNLVALDLGIDLRTPSGALMANVLASFAEYERRLIGQRTKDALEVLKSQGAALGRARWPYRPPCGHLSGSARRAAFVAGIGLAWEVRAYIGRFGC